ncbi:MAG: alkyl hydroperoxide reductase subunit C [Eubacteriales bacterium]|nr:alkyl hydroperoxide reductase subunit C [Eubacteriales bacterium]
MNKFIGKEILDFKLNAYQNNEFKIITKKDVLGKWGIFFFYPADFTFVCPTELKDMQDHYEDFKKENCEIYSISCDTHFVHKAWADASDTIKQIKYPMLADPTGEIAIFFEVLIKELGQALRATFVFNPEGKIMLYEINSNGIGRNAEELLRKLRAAKFVYENGDQVCPAHWHPGENTIKPSIDLVGIL